MSWIFISMISNINQWNESLILPYIHLSLCWKSNDVLRIFHNDKIGYFDDDWKYIYMKMHQTNEICHSDGWWKFIAPITFINLMIGGLLIDLISFCRIWSFWYFSRWVGGWTGGWMDGRMTIVWRSTSAQIHICVVSAICMCNL